MEPFFSQTTTGREPYSGTVCATRARPVSPCPTRRKSVAGKSPLRIARLTAMQFYCVFQLAILGSVASKIDGGWDTEPNTQYHIQTDEGPERYFKYQTISGQYRKERRLQDGSVVGTYGWVDADGYLRLNDYVADSKGYRIVKNKKVFVGAQAPVGQAVADAKYAPAIAGTGVPTSYRSASGAGVTRRPAPAVVAITPAPPGRESSWRGSPFVYPSDSQSSPLRFPSSTTSSASRSPYRRPVHRPSSTATPPADYYSVRPVDVNSIAAADDDADDGGDSSRHQPYRRRLSSSSSSAAAEQSPRYEQSAVQPHTFRPAYRKVVDMSAQGSEPEAQGYDGVSFVRNGFRYYLPRHYHEEQSDGRGDTRAGSYGYVDPFGIRRVVYYNTAPGTGFVHRKNNRYVGLDAEPYDPRPAEQ